MSNKEEKKEEEEEEDKDEQEERKRNERCLEGRGRRRGARGRIKAWVDEV